MRIPRRIRARWMPCHSCSTPHVHFDASLFHALSINRLQRIAGRGLMRTAFPDRQDKRVRKKGLAFWFSV